MPEELKAINNAKRKTQKGVTLLELILVMVIIGVLASVTLSAIDRVRERGLFDETMAEMKALIKAITGDPALISDGKRIDFGYVGDMGKLPDSLGSLVHPEGPLWKGPYYKLSFTEAREAYKKDAWGRDYQYLPEDLTLRSFGNGAVTLTSKIAESPDELFNNTVFGQVTDRENIPPGDFANKIKIKISYPKNGEMKEDSIQPTPSGSYQLSGIPIGRHRLSLLTPYETLEKFVCLPPNSRVMVDFKLPRTLKGQLVYHAHSCSVFTDDSSSFYFRVMNPTSETVKVFSLTLEDIRDTVGYYEKITDAEGIITYWDWYGVERKGEGVVADFILPLTFIPRGTADLALRGFNSASSGAGAPLNMWGRRVKIRFSEGSLIEFRVGVE